MALHPDGDISALPLGPRLRAVVEGAQYSRVDRAGRGGCDSGHSASRSYQRFDRAAGNSRTLPDTIRTSDRSGNPRSLWMATRMDRAPARGTGADGHTRG